jgi:hypothetical protein
MELAEKVKFLEDALESLRKRNNLLIEERDTLAPLAVKPEVFSIGYFKVPKPIPEGWLEKMYKANRMVPKAELRDGAWYFGRCRNAQAAQWDANRVYEGSEYHKSVKGMFVHIREKFGQRFPETINHPEDDDGFDVFWPVQRIDGFNAEDLRGKG